MHVLQRSLFVAAALCSCSEGRPLQGHLAQPVSWEEDISPLFSAQCNSCHSGPTAAANYRTTSYLEALGPTSAPVAIAGHADSHLLQVIDPARADAVHIPVSGAFAKTSDWVVPGQLSFFRSGIHDGGLMNPNDPQFHKYLVRDRGWNFSDCQSCHGTDLAGGKAGVSCQECHAFQVGADGVPTCASCHGSAQSAAPPRDLHGGTATSSTGVGAHQAHLTALHNLSARIRCDACHLVPTEVGSPGHVDHLRPAVLTFSGVAVADGATPQWNGTSCAGSYCHGGGAKLSTDTNAALQTPVWTLGTQVFCGSCHGVPPSTGPHQGVAFPNCSGCHPKTVTSNGQIIIASDGTSFHINGVIDCAPGLTCP